MASDGEHAAAASPILPAQPLHRSESRRQVDSALNFAETAHVRVSSADALDEEAQGLVDAVEPLRGLDGDEADARQRRFGRNGAISVWASLSIDPPLAAPRLAGPAGLEMTAYTTNASLTELAEPKVNPFLKFGGYFVVRLACDVDRAHVCFLLCGLSLASARLVRRALSASLRAGFRRLAFMLQRGNLIILAALNRARALLPSSSRSPWFWPGWCRTG